MKTMKNIVMLLLGVALVLSFAGASAAANVGEDHEVEVNMLGETGDYVFNIPASLTVKQDGSVYDNGEYEIIFNGDVFTSSEVNCSLSVTSKYTTDYFEGAKWTLNESSHQTGMDSEYVEFGIFLTENTGSYADSTYAEDIATWSLKSETQSVFNSKLWESISGNIYTVSYTDLEAEDYFKTFTGGLIFTFNMN